MDKRCQRFPHSRLPRSDGTSLGLVGRLQSNRFLEITAEWRWRPRRSSVVGDSEVDPAFM